MKLNRSRSYIFAILAIAASFPRSVSATDTRAETVGASGLFIEDESNIWYYPAALLRYPDRLIFNLGGQTSLLTPLSAMRTMSAFTLPGGTVLGVAFGSAEKKVTFAPLTAEEQIHLFWSRPAGNRNYGLRISRFGASREAAPDYKRTVSVTQIHAGMEFERSGGQVTETVISIQRTTFSNFRNGEAVTEPTGYWELGGRARWYSDLSKGIRFINVLSVAAGRRGIRFLASGSGTVTEKDEYITLQIGAAFEIIPQEGLLVIFHASGLFDYTVTTTSPGTGKSGLTIWDIPQAGLGIEKWIKPWLALRAGAMLRLQLTDGKEAGANLSAREMRAFSAQTLGLAVRHDGFQADMAIDPGMIRQGPHFMSGTSLPLFTKVTLSYAF